MIHVGYIDTSCHVRATDVFPELLSMCEKEMLDWVRRNGWQALPGYWVNNKYLIHTAPAHAIWVGMKDGTRHILSSHPKWEKWKDEFSPDEFYTFISLEKWE